MKFTSFFGLLRFVKYLKEIVCSPVWSLLLFFFLSFFVPYCVCGRSCMCFYETLLQNAQHFESNTALCKVSTKDSSYIVR